MAGSRPATWARIGAAGYMQITDRAKNVIKSDSAWIGSVGLENIPMAHHWVAVVACIAARHPKWDERPLLAVQQDPMRELSRVSNEMPELERARAASEAIRLPQRHNNPLCHFEPCSLA